MLKKVLIVDDEKDLLMTLEKRLTHAGYQVVSADNGNAALGLAEKEMPDLIILDVMMPGMEGSEVAARLREKPETQDIPIIFLTCLITKDEEAKMGREIAGSVFIAKPYDIEDLLREVKKRLY